MFCGPWTCLNGNRLSHKISTDSYIWWLFYMDLLACRALLGPHRHLQSSFQSDPRTRGEMIMFQAMQVFSSILPSRDFPQYVIWLHPLSTEQIFQGWRKRTQSYFLKGDYLLAENSYRGPMFHDHHDLLIICTVAKSDLLWNEGLAEFQVLR